MTTVASEPTVDVEPRQDGPSDLPPDPAGKAPARKRRPGRTRSRKASTPGPGDGSAPAPDRAPRGAAKAAATRRLEKELLGLYGGFGVLLKPFVPDVSAVVFEQAEPCAKSLAAWADHSPGVRRALTAATTGSVVGAVILAHVPIVLAAAAAMGGPSLSVPSAGRAQAGPPTAAGPAAAYSAGPAAPGSPDGYLRVVGDDDNISPELRTARATDGFV